MHNYIRCWRKAKTWLSESEIKEIIKKSAIVRIACKSPPKSVFEMMYNYHPWDNEAEMIQSQCKSLKTEMYFSLISQKPFAKRVRKGANQYSKEIYEEWLVNYLGMDRWNYENRI